MAASPNRSLPLSGRVPWVVLLYLMAAVPLIFAGYNRGRGQFDQQFFHERAIHRFAEEWSRGGVGGVGGVDVSDYLSATTPGYHLSLAAIANYLTGTSPDAVIQEPEKATAAERAKLEHSRLVLKLVGAIYTVAWLWVVSAAVRKRLTEPDEGGLEAAAPKLPIGSATGTLILLLPLVCSMHTLFSGVWLLPDNAGWLGVAVMLMLTLRRRWDWHSLIVGGVVMVLLVCTRQSHIWAAGLMWVAAWIGGTGERLSGRVDEEEGIEAQRHRGIEWVLQPSKSRIRRTSLALLATLPALLMLWWFWHLWGGSLINKNAELRSRHGTHPNFATPAFAMSLWAVFSLFFFAWFWPGVVSLWKSREGVVLLGLAVVLGVLAATIPETTFLYDDPATHESRATGLWNIVRVLEDVPVLGHHANLTIAGRTSPLILLLAPMGMVALAGWLTRLPARCPWVYGLSLAGFTLAQTANSAAWQRYLEPMLLMVLALMAAELASSAPGPTSRWMSKARWCGPVALGLVQAGYTAFVLWHDPPAVKIW